MRIGNEDGEARRCISMLPISELICVLTEISTLTACGLTNDILLS